MRTQSLGAIVLLTTSTTLTGCGLFGDRGPVVDDDAPTHRWVVLVLTNHAEMGDTGRPTGFWLEEAAHPWVTFRNAGYGVTLASPTGGAAPIDPRSLADPDEEGLAFLDRFAEGETVHSTLPLARIDPDDYAAIFFAGGHGTMWDFADSPSVKQKAEAIYASGGAIGAVCHGPAALMNLRAEDGSYLVKGKGVTAFTNSEEDAVELTDAMPFLLETAMRNRGAEFTSAENFEPWVVVDGRIVTGQNPASARGAAEAVVEIINDMRKPVPAWEQSK
jgi:putative intracellular protease/amidase